MGDVRNSAPPGAPLGIHSVDVGDADVEGTAHGVQVGRRRPRSTATSTRFDGTACHLDLVQWAHDPLWGQLDDVVQARLLAADRPFLVRQLTNERYRVIVVKGRTAMHWVERAVLVCWAEAARSNAEIRPERAPDERLRRLLLSQGKQPRPAIRAWRVCQSWQRDALAGAEA